MTHEMILTEKRGKRVAVVTLNRPDSLNAMHPVMLSELYDQVRAWDKDPSVGAIVVTGAGKGFCAGADVSGWARNTGPGTPERTPVSYEDWLEIVSTGKPVIAAINGAAVGWGLTMALVCDVRIASNAARLSARFLRAGVTPELCSSVTLQRIVGWGHAMEMMLTARLYSAEESLKIGLVTHVVPHDTLIDEAVKLADEIAFNPTDGLYVVKQLMWATLHDNDLAAARARERREFANAMKRPAFKEATAAFMEKRLPDFHKDGMD
ncbi:MAG: enoyl-CoA hydratase/isomerase family protein [Chloroflexi bacterium]|nr:enoyl-CoA hydratase/isomerase family protein [Chloroflexota bacterium]